MKMNWVIKFLCDMKATYKLRFILLHNINNNLHNAYQPKQIHVHSAECFGNS